MDCQAGKHWLWESHLGSHKAVTCLFEAGILLGGFSDSHNNYHAAAWPGIHPSLRSIVSVFKPGYPTVLSKQYKTDGFFPVSPIEPMSSVRKAGLGALTLSCSGFRDVRFILHRECFPGVFTQARRRERQPGSEFLAHPYELTSHKCKEGLTALAGQKGVVIRKILVYLRPNNRGG
jgi:hypothetical protein